MSTPQLDAALYSACIVLWETARGVGRRTRPSPRCIININSNDKQWDAMYYKYPSNPPFFPTLPVDVLGILLGFLDLSALGRLTQANSASFRLVSQCRFWKGRHPIARAVQDNYPMDTPEKKKVAASIHWNNHIQLYTPSTLATLRQRHTMARKRKRRHNRMYVHSKSLQTERHDALRTACQTLVHTPVTDEDWPSACYHHAISLHRCNELRNRIFYHRHMRRHYRDKMRYRVMPSLAKAGRIQQLDNIFLPYLRYYWYWIQ